MGGTVRKIIDSERGAALLTDGIAGILLVVLAAAVGIPFMASSAAATITHSVEIERSADLNSILDTAIASAARVGDAPSEVLITDPTDGASHLVSSGSPAALVRDLDGAYTADVWVESVDESLVTLAASAPRHRTSDEHCGPGASESRTCLVSRIVVDSSIAGVRKANLAAEHDTDGHIWTGPVPEGAKQIRYMIPATPAGDGATLHITGVAADGGEFALGTALVRNIPLTHDDGAAYFYGAVDARNISELTFEAVSASFDPDRVVIFGVEEAQ